MAHPENPPGGDKRNLFEVLKEILKKILGDKHKLELREAIEAQEKKEENETYKKRKEEIEKKKEADAERKRLILDERRSTQPRADEADYEAVKRNIQKDTVKDAKKELNQTISSVIENIETGYEGSFYVFEDYINDPGKLTLLNNLIDANPKVAEAILELAKKNSKAHTKPGELFTIGRIIYLNTPSSQREAIDSILTAISTRVKDLMNVEFISQEQNAANRGWRFVPENTRKKIREEVTAEIQPLLAPHERNRLLNEGEQAIDALLTSDFNRTGTVKPTEGTIKPKTLSLEAMKKIDNIWEEVEEAERSNSSLPMEKIEKIRRSIFKAESDSFPKDVFPNSVDYLNEVNAVREYTDKKLNSLAENFKERLEREGPQMKSGVTDTKEFLRLMAEHPGRLGELLLSNPEMYNLFVDTGEKSYKFRNQVFLRIHSSILTQRRESSNDNFGLYERADFTAFHSLLRSGVDDYKVKETGESVGQTWTDYYTGLSNTIRHSRDIDFWTSQPGATMEQLQKSLIMFQNEYTSQALSIPAVEQAFRAYETALTSIRDSNDGYIPPSLIDYDAVNMISFWDVSAQNLLAKFIAQGVVKDADREFDRTGGMPIVSEDGVSVKLGESFKGIGDGENEVDPLELKMYLTLAKGFGMVSMRLPEIVANSKIPGYDMPGFHSPAFEGIITALNHWNVFTKKWKHMAYKYFFMINTVLPYDKKLPVGEGGAEIAYRHYLDGTFEEKYGKTAKSMFDSMNYSRTHGAFGPTTPWRTLDNTTGWTDKQRELLGGPTRILLAHRIAADRIKQAIVGDKYKEEFRQRKRLAGQPSVGADFEALWQSEGLSIYGSTIDVEWEQYKHHHEKEAEELDANFQKVFKARMWVETAMRNPLAIAHNAMVAVPILGYGPEDHRKNAVGKYHVEQKIIKKIKLHSYIVEQVLGISPEDLETGTVVDGEAIYRVNASKYTSPTLEQRRNMSQVLDLEGDLAAVREVALENNRELTEKDFDDVIGGGKETTRSRHAKEYWKLVKKFITGSENPDLTEIYDRLGIKYHTDPSGKEMEYYNIDWEKIRDADDKIFKHFHGKSIEFSQKTGNPIVIDTPKAFDEDFLNTDWSWYFATDDTSFRRMAFLNLGNRQWVRRGADVQAHYIGGLELDKYLDISMTPNPDVHDLAKQLMAIRQGYQGDDVSIGYRICSQLAFLTSKLYEFIPSRFGSVAQLDLWKTRRNVAAWSANKRREFWDALEHIDLLPPHAEFEHWEFKEPFNIHKLRKLNHADNTDVWTEIVLLGLLLAIAITIWRAFTAKSEEEEGGGGGHH